jgi:hypothetical protein
MERIAYAVAVADRVVKLFLARVLLTQGGGDADLTDDAVASEAERLFEHVEDQSAEIVVGDQLLSLGLVPIDGAGAAPQHNPQAVTTLFGAVATVFFPLQDLLKRKFDRVVVLRMGEHGVLRVDGYAFGGIGVIARPVPPA